MGDHRPRAAELGRADPFGDNVKRWQEEVLPDYPQARYVFAAPFYTGALRDGDDVMQRTNLGQLINALLAREAAGRG